MIMLLGILITILSVCDAQNLTFFQNEYHITLDIAKCTWFNTAFYKYFKADFVPYNRTTRVLNASWELVMNLGNDELIHIQVYKFTSNEYRFFPLTVTFNTCAEYQKNSFGLKDTLSKASNHNPCGIKKGVYYVRNAMPDFSKFPPQMPRGKYKMVWKMLFYSETISELEFYGTIKDKPVDWKKLPKHNQH